MHRNRKMIIGLAAVMVGAAAIAFAAGDFGGAERAYGSFKKQHDELRKMTPDETQKLVTAICEAEEAERASVARDAASRVKDKVEDEYEELEDFKDDAMKRLEAVLADKSLESKHGKAKEYRSQILAWWASIDKMTRSLRGANHPVVAYTLEEGQKAHKKRQEDSSFCDVAEFPLAGGKADCIEASTCTVIELKPNNSKAIRKGKGQVERYADELDKKGDAFEALVKKNKDFAKCGEFKKRVDCYQLCPVIDASGEFREASAKWDEDCR